MLGFLSSCSVSGEPVLLFFKGFHTFRTLATSQARMTLVGT